MVAFVTLVSAVAVLGLAVAAIIKIAHWVYLSPGWRNSPGAFYFL
jgi:hypothetical protein